MNLRGPLVAIFTILSVISTVRAGEPPPPRPPIGPSAMRPPREGLDSRPIAPNQIRIINISDQQLFIAYSDGASSWKNVTIGSGLAANIQCLQCGDEVSVAFHNGKENVSVKVKIGSAYSLGWSAQQSAWVLTPGQ
jgi:hypothetical protein